MSNSQESAGLEPSVYKNVHTPAGLSGLEPVSLGLAITIETIGLDSSAVDVETTRDSLAIVVGEGAGIDFMGNPHDYVYDTDISVTRIVDVSEDPFVVVADNGRPQRANFASLTWGQQNNSEQRQPILTPLLPGVVHKIKDIDNKNAIADYQILEDGALQVRRYDNDDDANVRIVGLHDHHSAYTTQEAVALGLPEIPETILQELRLAGPDKLSIPPQSPPSPENEERVVQSPAAQHGSSRTASARRTIPFVRSVQGRSRFIYPDKDGLKIDPGYRISAIDAQTGETVTYTVLRPMWIPAENPGRYTDYVAGLLKRRQSDITSDRRFVTNGVHSAVQYRQR